MKTPYVKPTSDVVTLKTESLMIVVSGEGTQEVSVSSKDFNSSEGDYYSRRDGFWDDED